MAARPTTRRSPAAVADRRPAVRGFTGGASVPIEWDVRPAFDFVFSLYHDAGATDDLPEPDRRWLRDARAGLPAELAADVAAVVDSELAIHAASFLVGRREVRSAADVVAALEAAEPTEVVRAILTEYTQEPERAAVVERFVAGDGAALGELHRLLGDDCRAIAPLLDDPFGEVGRFLAVVRAWAGPFTTIEPRVAAILERDHALREDDRAAYAGADLIERTTGGVRWLPEPGSRVILSPSYFSRPYNFLLAGEGWRFFGYPVADAALEAGDPLAAPQGVVRLHRALGDPTRLRILKLLAGTDLYLTEIAQQLDLSKPTIKHHLALLRAAGLVTVTEAGAVIYYSLRRDRLDEASADLGRFLAG